MARYGPRNLSSRSLEIGECCLVALLRICRWYELNRQAIHNEFCELVLDLGAWRVEGRSITVAYQS